MTRFIIITGMCTCVYYIKPEGTNIALLCLRTQNFHRIVWLIQLVDFQIFNLYHHLHTEKHKRQETITK